MYRYHLVGYPLVAVSFLLLGTWRGQPSTTTATLSTSAPTLHIDPGATIELVDQAQNRKIVLRPHYALQNHKEVFGPCRVPPDRRIYMFSLNDESLVIYATMEEKTDDKTWFQESQ